MKGNIEDDRDGREESYTKYFKRFEEKYPDERVAGTYRGRISSCPSFTPPFIQKEEDHPWEGGTSTIPFSGINIYLKRATCNDFRRTSWELINNELDKNIVSVQRTADDSRRSSAASIPEVIEECSSDDEESTDPDVDVDYMLCINCTQSSSSSSLSSTNSYKHQNMNYCYKCKHLFQSKKVPLPSSPFTERRRSSWTNTDTYNSPVRQPRRGSLTTDNNDLPAIFEPTFDVETNDTMELQLQVEKEVDKLIKFRKNVSRRKTIGCPDDVKNMKRIQKKFQNLKQQSISIL